MNAPADAVVIDGTGKFVTPGIIDIHSHLGVYSAPGVEAKSDGNEATRPVTAYVWAEHSVWPQDPQFPRNLAGGVTTLQVLPGSANLIGGRSVVLKVVPSRTVQGMKFPGAKYGLKMACGENPKRVYGNKGGPPTRMGNVAGYRTAWIEAEQYRRKWDKWNADKKGDPPARDLNLETLAEVLRGNILVHNHCYRADEMAQMIDIAHEFGYKIRAFHHGVEAYKIADLLAKEGIGAAIWADWGGFKMEALDGIHANLALTQPGRRQDDRALRRSVGLAAPESGSGQGDRSRQGARHRHLRGSGDQVAHDQSGVGARSRFEDRIDRGRQGCGRRALVGRSVQRVHARREGVDRRRAALRSRRRQGAMADGLRSRLRSAGWRCPVKRSMNRRALALVATLAIAAPLSAQTVAITGGKVYPVSGPPIEGGTVLIRDGKIVAVGKDIAIPAGAERVDATGKWVTPGLVNANTNLGFGDVGFSGGPREQQAKGHDGIAAGFQVWLGFNTQSVMIAPAREGGVTTVVAAPIGRTRVGTGSDRRL